MNVEELRDYLEAQIELGTAEIFFDEPWSLPKKKTIPNVSIARTIEERPVVQERVLQVPSSVRKIPEKPSIQKPNSTQEPLSFSALQTKPLNVQNDFASVNSLEELYVRIEHHPMYQGKKIFRGCGKFSPKVFILLDFPLPEDFSGTWQNTPVGQMLERMFKALSIPSEECYFSYMYKSLTDRVPSPLLDTTLRNILEKELFFIKPEILVVFGELAMRQVFGRDKSLRQLAGLPLEFAATRTVVLHSAKEMLSNVALKKETWNIFIPKCGFFENKN